MTTTTTPADRLARLTCKCPDCRPAVPANNSQDANDNALATAVAASPAAGHEWYASGLSVAVFLPNGESECASCLVHGLPPGKWGHSKEHTVQVGGSPVSYLRAREILGAAWPASWPQTDPDATPDQSGDATDMIAKAADADGWDYYVDRTCPTALWRYRVGNERGLWVEAGSTWHESCVRRSTWGGMPTEFGPASRADCERFLGWPATNPDAHGNGDQSRCTEGATIAALDRNRAGHHDSIMERTLAAEAAAHAAVFEWARLSLIGECALDLRVRSKAPEMPKVGADVAEWRAYADAMESYSRTNAEHTKANAAAQEYRRANLAALKAALGVK